VHRIEMPGSVNPPVTGKRIDRTRLILRRPPTQLASR
jgi:hypothetical protein